MVVSLLKVTACPRCPLKCSAHSAMGQSRKCCIKDKHKNILLWQESQKLTCYMILVLGHFQNKQICRKRKHMVWGGEWDEQVWEAVTVRSKAPHLLLERQPSETGLWWWRLTLGCALRHKFRLCMGLICDFYFKRLFKLKAFLIVTVRKLFCGICQSRTSVQATPVPQWLLVILKWT